MEAQIRPYRESMVVLGTAAPSVCAGPMTYPLAMLEARLGHTDAALGLLAQAERKTQQIGANRWRDRIRRSREHVEQSARVASG